MAVRQSQIIVRQSQKIVRQSQILFANLRLQLKRPIGLDEIGLIK